MHNETVYDDIMRFWFCLGALAVVLVFTFLSINRTIARQQSKEDTKENAIVFSDMKYFKVSTYFKDMSEKNIKKIQKAIDKGEAVVAYNKLDNNDGKLSYIAGHNPGIMSKFADFIKENREVCVVDTKGKSRYYTLKFFAKQAKKQRTACKEVADLLKKADKTEAVLFQFCEGKEIHYWLASPKDKE